MNSTGIVGTIRQRLKDIELQHWMSEINNAIRRDTDQNNKMTTYGKFKTIENYKCEDYLRQVTNTKITIKQPQTRNRNGPILTLKKNLKKENVQCVN